MLDKKLLPLIAAILLLNGSVCFAIEPQHAMAFVGQDLHLSGEKVISFQQSTAEHILVFPAGFTMEIGANRFSSNSAVLWLESITNETRGKISIDYKAKVYLEGNISVEKGKAAKAIGIKEAEFDGGGQRLLQFVVTGEVFVTAQAKEVEDPRDMELYKRADAVDFPTERIFIVQPGAEVPQMPAGPAERSEASGDKVIKEDKQITLYKPDSSASPQNDKRKEVPAKAEVPKKEVTFKYPVNYSPVGETEFQIAWDDNTKTGTIIGRVYVWQRYESDGKIQMLELQADNAVMYCSDKKTPAEANNVRAGGGLAGADIEAVYMAGNVVLTQGHRTIRADEIYYDFKQEKAIAVNADMRTFDVKRDIPIYIRAAKLRRVAENQFSAEKVTITCSEFYKPQISLTASNIIVTDTTAVDQEAGKLSDRSLDARMYDTRLKLHDMTVFYWPYLRSDLQRPDIPIKSLHYGHDSTWGHSVESRWYLSRLLGLREPKGTDSTFALDYYQRRGTGTGAEIEYEREKSFGDFKAYLIHDTGEDKLGRHQNRRNLKPDNEYRGRLTWQHRQFLPYNWQLTTGFSYLSDENFIEGYNRNEFNTGNKQETYVHLKRIEDNRAVSFLAKGRINDFADQMEEMPSGEFHWTGQSLFDDTLTMYSDTQAGRFRQRIGDEHNTDISQENFTFVSHRTELDMPFNADNFKIVPFVAGTFGYDDRSGFTRTLVDGTNSGSFGEDMIGIGEAGMRLSPRPLWKVYPDVKSRLWDLNQLRHVIKPEITAVLYEETDSVVEQHDILNVGLYQVLQTKRGREGSQRNVDWMELDMDFTWVNDSESAADSGADRFIWNKPIVPLRVLAAPEIFNGELWGSLKRFEMYGPRRNYFSADYRWRISDTTAVLSDIYYDMQSSVVGQFDIGFSRMVWPNLTYYIGSRYLRRVNILDEKGSNALTFAATYVLDPRYTVVFGQQYDFDYGKHIRSDITLIRRYHRLYCGFTYSADESLDRNAIVFSIWPQGIPDMAIGPRRYMNVFSEPTY